MRFYSLILTVFLVSCGMAPNVPVVNPSNPKPSEPTQPVTEPTKTPETTTPTVTTSTDRPCVLVEETTFNETTDQSIWKPSYYYNTPSQYPLTFASDGISFKSSGSYRSGVTIDIKDRDVTICPSLAFRIQGTIKNQTLGGAGWDNREAPVAVMIQYTDSKGVRHNTLKAFNEGEEDDRNTTRMIWHGYGYLNPASDFGYGFTPSLTAVKQNVKFDETSLDLKKLDIKIIHTITIEASGWGLESVVSQFAMKPLEAFADPQAPYRNGPVPPQPVQKQITGQELDGNWEAINPSNPSCKRSFYFYHGSATGGNFDYNQECNPYDVNSAAFRYGTYIITSLGVTFTSDGKSGLASTFVFGSDMFGTATAVILPNGQLTMTDSATKEVVVFTKEILP